MWACVYTSACACAGVFARARTCTYMGIVRVHVHMCRVRNMHVHCAGACLHVTACMCVARVRVRMCECAGVFARVRAHARVLMRGACVRAWSGPRVPGCMRVCARAPVCVVCMCMRVLTRVRAHESVSALMRECACICMWAYADMCMFKMYEHIKVARVVSKKQHRRQEGATCRLYIYISLSFLSLPSSPSLSWYHHISV